MATTERRDEDTRSVGAEAELPAVLEATVDGIVTVDTGGRIATCNPAAEHIFGYRAEELLGQHVVALAPPSHHEVQRRLFGTCLAATEPGLVRRRVEVVGLKKDGSTFPFELSLYRVQSHGRTFITGIMHDLTDIRAAEEALVGVSETVRASIGQELHDMLGQQLTGVALLAKSLENALSKEGSSRAELAKDIGRLAQGALDETRRLAHGLYPTALERQGLAPALAELAHNQQKLFGIPCRFRGHARTEALPTAGALHLYRIAQEAVDNALKHAGTDCVDIVLREEHGALTVVIQGQGAGCRGRAKPGGVGLMIMEYRARMIGAEIEFCEQEDGVTRVVCTLPVGHRHPHAEAPA